MEHEFMVYDNIASLDCPYFQYYIINVGVFCFNK